MKARNKNSPNYTNKKKIQKANTKKKVAVLQTEDRKNFVNLELYSSSVFSKNDDTETEGEQIITKEKKKKANGVCKGNYQTGNWIKMQIFMCLNWKNLEITKQEQGINPRHSEITNLLIRTIKNLSNQAWQPQRKSIKEYGLCIQLENMEIDLRTANSETGRRSPDCTNNSTSCADSRMMLKGWKVPKKNYLKGYIGIKFIK